MHCSLCLFRIFLLDKVFSGCFRQVFKKVVADRGRQVVVLHSNDCMEFAWVDSGLVVLDKWSSYRGGHLNKFDCNALS